MLLSTLLLFLSATSTPALAWPQWRDAVFVDSDNTTEIQRTAGSAATGSLANSSLAAPSRAASTATGMSANSSIPVNATSAASAASSTSTTSSNITIPASYNSSSTLPYNLTSPDYNSTTLPPPLNYTPPYPPFTSSFNTSYVPYPLNASYPGHSEHISSNWLDAHRRARVSLANWTLEEKVNLTTGAGWEVGRCVGNIPAIPSQGFPGLCLEDSPLGVRFADFVSAFPAGINAASTFDKDLMYARGYAMGQEFRGKGVHVALGPMTNMGRVVAGGRNWEGFGGDPYLSGWATEMTIKGMQDAGIQACVKHYVGNEQERNRTTSSSNIDDRTMREIYTHPFLRAVAADVASVMCSYNLINGSWACQNSETLNGILKTDFGFQGYVMSDWQATESGVGSVEAGLDMTMPGDIVFNSLTSYFGTNLTQAVNNGSVAMERVDDMAERILSAYYLLGQDQDYPEVSFDAFRRMAPENNSHVDVRDDHYKVIQHIGAASTVLLKNVNNTLPLKAPRSIAVIGEDMGPARKGPNGYADRGGIDGTLAMGWGSGTAEFPYLVDPLSAIAHQARRDGSTVNWWLDNFDTDGANQTALGADVAIVGISADSGEYYIIVDGNIGDRNNLSAWLNGDELVKAVAGVNNNTVVVIHSVGPIIMEEWIDHPNVTAVLWAGLPGQESGNSLVDVLYGAYNPSGRLPYTIAKERSDYSADIIYVDTDTPAITEVDYTEGLNIDYRHFLARNITPRFGFGFGLSYTSFEYGEVDVEWIGGGERKRWWVGDGVVSGARNGNKTVGTFLSDELQAPLWRVTTSVTNTGDTYGCDIPQLYLSFSSSAGEPPRVLRDFSRVTLSPGDTAQVEWTLSRYDVSIWDVVAQGWRVPAGEFEAVVAPNAFDEGSKGAFCPSGKGC